MSLKDEEMAAMKDVLMEVSDKEIEVEKVLQLLRIADALESIEETGVYTYPQSTEDPMDDQRSGRRQG